MKNEESRNMKIVRLLGVVGLIGLIGLVGFQAGAVSTNNTAVVLLPLRTASGLTSGRAITVVPTYNPLTDMTNWNWGAPMVFFSTSSVPGWGTNVALMRLTPNAYTLSVDGVPGTATIGVGTNHVGNTNWAATLTTNLLTASFAGQTNITYTYSYWVTTNFPDIPVTIDVQNTMTNTYGGLLTVLGPRVQEGDTAKATGNPSHAEGWTSSATNNSAHAEGYGTVAGGIGAHAEGLNSLASGNYSHAGGAYSKATNANAWVWSDGSSTSFGSTTTKQFSAFAINGFRLMGGSIEGNGGALTNLSGRYITATNAPGAGNALRYNGTNFYWAN